jgi:hypothetical protein
MGRWLGGEADETEGARGVFQVRNSAADTVSPPPSRREPASRHLPIRCANREEIG